MRGVPPVLGAAGGVRRVLHGVSEREDLMDRSWFVTPSGYRWVMYSTLRPSGESHAKCLLPIVALGLLTFGVTTNETYKAHDAGVIFQVGSRYVQQFSTL